MDFVRFLFERQNSDKDVITGMILIDLQEAFNKTDCNFLLQKL